LSVAVIREAGPCKLHEFTSAFLLGHYLALH
jgi:hypothetical protein